MDALTKLVSLISLGVDRVNFYNCGTQRVGLNFWIPPLAV